jgi:hypothetical protein
MKSNCFTLIDWKQQIFWLFSFLSGFRQPDFSVVLLKVTTMEKPSWFLNIYHSRGTQHLYPYIFINVISGLSTLRMYKSLVNTALLVPAAQQRNFNLYIPRKGIARPQSQFPHCCVYIFLRSVHLFIFLQHKRQADCGNI